MSAFQEFIAFPRELLTTCLVLRSLSFSNFFYTISFLPIFFAVQFFCYSINTFFDFTAKLFNAFNAGFPRFSDRRRNAEWKNNIQALLFRDPPVAIVLWIVTRVAIWRLCDRLKRVDAQELRRSRVVPARACR